MASPAQREHLQRLMRLLLEHEPQVHYPPHDVRGPLDLRTFQLTEAKLIALLKAGGQVQADCSELVTELCRWAGLHDPNRLGYSRPGWTGTMLAALPHYTNPKAARAGALLVLGPDPGEHVCMVLEPDAKHGNPLLFSHGQERGPLAVRYAIECGAHHPPARFLPITHL